MKLNLKDLKIYNIDGTPIENAELHKTVANIIYTQAQNLDLVSIAMDLFKNGEVDIRSSELQEIRKLVLGSNLPAFVRKILRDYFDELKEQEMQK